MDGNILLDISRKAVIQLLLSVTPPHHQFTPAVFCNQMGESNSELIRSQVSISPRCLLFCHIPQAESRFFTLAFTFPLN